MLFTRFLHHISAMYKDNNAGKNNDVYILNRPKDAKLLAMWLQKTELNEIKNSANSQNAVIVITSDSLFRMDGSL